jgi:hypothetical protein
MQRVKERGWVERGMPLDRGTGRKQFLWWHQLQMKWQIFQSVPTCITAHVTGMMAV